MALHFQLTLHKISIQLWRLHMSFNLKSLIFTMTLTCLNIAHADDSGKAQPFPPFKVIGNIYFVGNKDQADFLIVTPKGNILLNTDYEVNVPQIKDSIKQLGFNYSDTKIILISQAHYDHDEGSALIKKETGATYMVMDKDVAVVESGGKKDFAYGDKYLYPPAKVDRVLHDGDTVELGGTQLVAHLTPGHTKGCTTYTMKVTSHNKTYNAVFIGGTGVNPEFKLVDNKKYPQIVNDYKHTFAILKSLPCDVYLGAHGSYFDIDKKYALLKTAKTNPFIDPIGYQKHIAEEEKRFNKKLAKAIDGK